MEANRSASIVGTEEELLLGELKELLNNLPINPSENPKIEALIKKCSLNVLFSLGLKAPLPPAVPRCHPSATLPEKLMSIQGYISSFHYNFVTGYNYNVRKKRPFCRIMDTATEIMKNPLPIKCIEAVFLGMLLTHKFKDLDRFPLSFKTSYQDNIYKHIVLVVRDRQTCLFGVLGISRRFNLMYKDLEFRYLSAVIKEFIECYQKWGHRLVRLRIGLPVEHNLTSYRSPCWQCCEIYVKEAEYERLFESVDRFVSSFRSLLKTYDQSGIKPEFH